MFISVSYGHKILFGRPMYSFFIERDSESTFLVIPLTSELRLIVNKAREWPFRTGTVQHRAYCRGSFLQVKSLCTLTGIWRKQKVIRTGVVPVAWMERKNLSLKSRQKQVNLNDVRLPMNHIYSNQVALSMLHLFISMLVTRILCYAYSNHFITLLVARVMIKHFTSDKVDSVQQLHSSNELTSVSISNSLLTQWSVIYSR